MGINYLNFFNNSFIFQINLESSGLMPMEVPSYIDDCEAVANGFGLTGSENKIGKKIISAIFSV